VGVVVAELATDMKVVVAVAQAELYSKKIKPYLYYLATTTQSKLAQAAAQMNQAHTAYLAQVELL
jgi:hypothetical protein